MGPIGVQEMIAIFVVALVLFGPKKLPELGRTLGKALSEFRRAKNELKSSFETHLHELEREARLSELQSPTTPNYSSTPDYSSPHYPHPYDEYGRTGYDASYSHEEPVTTHEQPLAAIAPPETEPVSGTVPRSKGAQAAEPVSAKAEQDRTA